MSTEPQPVEPDEPGLEEPGLDEPRRYPSTIGGAFYLVILAVASAGLVVVAFGPWRRGIQVFASALIAAAGLRLILRERDAGMLAVRSRWLDAVILAGSGAAMWFLAVSIPDQAP